MRNLFQSSFNGTFSDLCFHYMSDLPGEDLAGEVVNDHVDVMPDPIVRNKLCY